MSMLFDHTYKDHELIILLRQGNTTAISCIYERYWKRLYLYAFSILRDSEQAQDIVQDLFVQLWVRRSQAEIHKLDVYLHQAVRYSALAYIRSANSRKVFVEEGELELLAGAVDPNDYQHVNEITLFLEQEVLALPKRCREVFVLSRVEFLSNKEIAGRMGITVKAVEFQMTVALKRLRNKLSDFLVWSLLILSLLF